MNVGDRVRPVGTWQCGCNDAGTVEQVSKPEDLFDEPMVKVSTPCGWMWVETATVVETSRWQGEAICVVCELHLTDPRENVCQGCR